MSDYILVVEDDKRMREITCDYLETAGYRVLEATDGIQALAVFEREPVHLVILDIMMPGLDGWTVCRRIRQKSDCLIVIVSARSEEDDKLLGYELGADEYITKPFSPKVLVAGVTALLKRSRIGAALQHIVCQKELIIDRDCHRAAISGEEMTLTSKEYELLLKLAEYPGKVYTRDALISSIWGYDYIGDGRVVDTNIKTLRRKLGSRATYIQTVIGVGYRFEAPL